MDDFLTGFSSELEKIGSSSKTQDADFNRAIKAVSKTRYKPDSSYWSKGKNTSKNYLAAAVLGAMTAPAVFLAGRGAGRVFHNSAVKAAIKATKSPRKRLELKKQFQTGPVVSTGIPRPKPGLEPLISTSEAGGQAVRGALYGSALQMLKDRYTIKSSKKKT